MIQDSIATTELSAQEIDKARDYLLQTRDAFVETLTALTAAQWTFRPRPDCRSIAEIAEHQVLRERAVQRIVDGIGKAPEPPAGCLRPAPMARGTEARSWNSRPARNSRTELRHALHDADLLSGI